MKLTLNLAHAKEERVRWRRAALWGAALLAVVGLGAAQGLHARSLARGLAPIEGRLRTLEAEAARLGAAQGAAIQPETREALAALPGRVEGFNRILAAAAFPWTGLLMELEASLPPRVGLTAIQPDPASGAVVLQGMARSLADVTAFVHLLEERPTFRNVFLMRHAEQGRGEGADPRLQNFTIRLVYGAAS